MKNIKKYIVALVATLSIMSCQKNDMDDDTDDLPETKVALSFSHSASLGDVLYDGVGNKFELTKFKYFITDVVLHTDMNTNINVSNDIGAAVIITGDANQEVTHIMEGITPGTYNGISFKIGVSEEIYNQGADEQGVLLSLAGAKEEDGSNLFWSWTQGYVYVKLEGTLLNVQGIDEIPFLRHVGNTGTIVEETRTDRVKEVTINFGDDRLIVGDMASAINLDVAIEAILAADVDIDLSDDPGNMFAGADEMATNTPAIFTFNSIE